LCFRCQTTPLSVAPVRSALLFEGAVRDAIHALKYRGAEHIADVLAVKMADAWRYYDMMGDLLVPVPLHPEREAQRGYNQAKLLARALAPKIARPLADDTLYRVRPTRSQAHLDRKERWKNVADAFTCPDAVDLSGLSVVLIDDVATTGATLDACAVALLTRGAKQVSALTLAHAV
jgi:ComF family protein